MSRKRDNADRGGDDQPATRDQIECLRQISKLGEGELDRLGRREAAELIDRLRAEQRAMEEALLAPGRRAGCIKGLMILFLLAAIAGMLWVTFHKEEAGKLRHQAVRTIGQWLGHEGAGETGEAPAATPPRAPAPGATAPEPSAPEAKAPARTVEPPAAADWPPAQLPARYRTTQAVELLAADGSGVKIPAGQVLYVVESTRPNVWKFRHGGRELIGSGGRVEGKLARMARESPME